MKTSTVIVTILFAMASFPLLAQQPRSANQPNGQATQQSSQATEQAPASSPAVGPETPAVQMSPVNGELVSNLDSKTAKSGDSVVIRTKASVKTADGTDIPKGSKLVGHVIGAKPSGAGENSQVALKFDHLETNGGQSMPILLVIQSIAPAGGGAGATSASAAGNSSNPGTSGAHAGSKAAGAPEDAAASPAATAAGAGAPAPGTVVGTSGKIAIRTTSVPGVMLANNAPGQQDPRMAQTSSILLGAKQDIHLDGGTQMVLGISAAGGGAQ